MTPFNEVPKYRRFTSEMDLALERLHRNAQKDISGYLHEGLIRIEEIVARSHALIPQSNLFTAQSHRALTLIDARIGQALDYVGLQVLARWQKLRRHTHILSAAGEREAIAGVMGTKGHITITKADLDKVEHAPTWNDEQMSARIWLALNRIKYKVLSALELAKVQELNQTETIEAVRKAFPKSNVYLRPPRVLKPLREAAKEKTEALTTTFITDEEWEAMLDSYIEAEIPFPRFMNEPLDVSGLSTQDLEALAEERGKSELDAWYSWEIEQEMTQDFVSGVRDGKNAAANEAGIKDFVFVAILDESTDECCAWRAGLTVSEIEAQLEGKRSDEADLGAIPPIHFNCRCVLAPVGDVPERVELDLGEFDSWLSQP